MPPLKLAFCGKMRSGKDTAAERVISQINNLYDCKIMKFADPIYDISNYAQMRAGLKPKKDRALMQMIGTDWGRDQISKSIWIDTFKQDVLGAITAHDNQLKNLCILNTDCRFINESTVLKELGFTLIMVTRPEQARIDAGAELTTHASELEIDYLPKDWVIENNGSLTEFYNKIDNLVFKLCNVDFPINTN